MDHRHAYSALGDANRVRMSVERGLAEALNVAGCLNMVKAWASQIRKPHLTRRCFEKAESLASTPAEWVAIAEAHYENECDETACRVALKRATPDAKDDVLRKVAFGYRHSLGDEEEAERLSPRGVDPSDLASLTPSRLRPRRLSTRRKLA